jgi:hypothetical protein
MNRNTLLCGTMLLAALPGFATMAKADDQAIIQRLDKLERENAALRERLNHVEHKGTAAPETAIAGPRPTEPPPASGRQANVALKAPVEYVRACKVYGAGFYTVPGTEACIKIGGYVRLQGTFNGSGEGTVNGADNMAPQGRNTRTDSSVINYDARAVTSLDARIPTSLGTLRGYMRMGAEMDTPLGSSWMTTLAQPTQSIAPSVFWDRGYIQFAGFTVGKTRSFFDIFSASDGFLTYGNMRTTGDTDLTGVILAAFTYNWGNGVSTSISVEDPNGHYKVGVANLNAVSFGLGTLTTENAYDSGTTVSQGMGMPDIIANFRVDQSWGYAGISGALHQVAGGYYSGPSTAGSGFGCAGTPCVNYGHPSDKLGFAVAGGGDVFVPTGAGDTLGVNLVYSEGAVDFATKGNRWQLYNGNSAGFAWGVDGVFDNITPFCPAGGGNCPSGVQLTNAWSVNAGYEHHWSEQWKTSLYGGYAAVSYNQTATNILNQHLPTPPVGGRACGMPVEGTVQPPLNVGTGAGNSCSPNYSFWQVGSRTQFSPTTWLDLGVDATYTRLNSAYAGSNVILTSANGAQPGGNAAGGYTIESQNVWMVMARAQISLLPGK